MNVLLLTAEFPPEVRSAALLMSEFAGSMAGRGHRVTVITAAPPDARTGSLFSPAVEERDGVRVLRIPTLAVHRSSAGAIIRGLMQLINAFAFFVAALAVKEAQVTVAYSPPLALGIVGALLHRLRGIPHLLNVQDLVPQYAIDLGVLKNRSLIRLLKWVEGAVYRNVQLITVHSPGNAAYLIREGVPASKVAVVPNWVDTARIRPSSSQTPYRKNAGLEGRFVALFAGALGFAQDLDTVLDAAALLRRHPRIVFLIVGDGVEKARLQEKARALDLANVRFMPVVTSEQYPEVVASADLCLATLQRSLLCPVVPSKLLGYMAAGRPIVAGFPEGGDAPRVIREAGCGLSVPAGEPERMAQAILEASDNPDEWRARGERGRRFVEANHDRQRAMALYDSLLGSLAGAGAVVEPG
jgi:glycosyltransferase involved in cell wall biosynthesis